VSSRTQHSHAKAFGRAVVALTALALVGVACGGTSKPKASVATSTTETTAVGEQSTTTVAPAQETATSTTAAPTATGNTTATTRATAKKTATSTGKAVTVPPAKRTVTGGIGNVVAAPTTAPSKDVQPGGTLTWLQVSDTGFVDPIRVQNFAASDGPIGAMLYDMLVYTDQSNGVVKPQTAQSLTSTDGLVWTLKLQPNIKFSDGTVYDASAVKFNWLRLQDPANAAARAAQANTIASMDVLDPLTLKLTLKDKNAVFPQTVATIPFIGSPAAIQAEGNDKFNSQPVGAGPFTLKSWTRDSNMVFVRNPNYWQAPRPYLDQVILRIVNDETQRVNTFLAGDANMMFTNQPASSAPLTKGGAVQYSATLNGGTNMYFNVRKKPFSDIRVRQAIAMAIDRTDINNVANGGVIPPMNSAFRETSPFYDPGILQLPYDPVKAQQLFDQFAADNGGPLTFTLTGFNTGVYNVALPYIQAKLNSFRNVKVSIVAEAAATHNTRLPNGDFEAALYAIPFDDPEPGWTGLFTCNAPATPSGYCNSNFDALAADQRQTLDPQKRIADIKDMQKIFYSDVPTFFFQRRVSWQFAAPNVQDVALANDGLPLIDRIWIKSHG
jgi:peptide/nickel transport system substrate-binding protein